MSTQDLSMTTFSSQVKRTVAVSAYKARIADDGTYTYTGLAKPGSATSSSVWQIKRVANASGNIDWADSDLNFNNIWDNRTSLTYG